MKRAIGTALGAGLALALTRRRRSSLELAGRVALVTGGSRGLGFLLAQELLDAACRIVKAIRRGERRVTLSLPARFLGLAHDLAPGAMGSLLRNVNRILPSADGQDSLERRGRDVRNSLPTRWLDRRLQRGGRHCSSGCC